MSKRRLLKLFAILAVTVSSVAANRSPAVAEHPCHRVGFCLVCHASNQDCVVIFCPNGLHTDCEF